MCRIVGSIFPNGGFFHVHAGYAQFCNSAQLIFAGIVQKYIVGKGADTVAQSHLVTNADNSSCLFIGPLIGETVDIPKALDQHRGGNIRVQTTDIFEV